MVNSLRQVWRTFKSAANSAFALRSGKQRSVDIHRLFLSSADFYAGLRRDQKLTLFEAIKDNVPLAAGALQVLVKMANTRMLPQSGDPLTDNRMREIWDRIGGTATTQQLLLQGLTFGFAIGEINWDDVTLEIESVKVLRSLQTRKQVDRAGNVTNYLQYASPPAPGATQGKIEIPPHKAISFVHMQEDGFQYYGNSIFSSAIPQLESLCEVLNASINVFNRVGKPRYMITVNDAGLGEEEFEARLVKAEKAFSKLADGDDIYAPTGFDVKIIGSESFGVPFEQESRLLVSHCLAALGVPPALVHLTQGAGSTESFTRQTVIALQQMLTSIQTSAADAWNRGFWKLVQRLAGMTTTPKMSFAAPRLLEQLLEEKARSAKFTNDLRETAFGIRPELWLPQQCGATTPDNPTVLSQMIEKYRESYDGKDEESNQETNTTSTTKGTDERATGNTSS